MNPLDDLAAHVSRLREIEEALPDLVTQARRNGASWSDLGRALGTTRQAAYKRFRKVDEPRPTPPPWRLAGR